MKMRNVVQTAGVLAFALGVQSAVIAAAVDVFDQGGSRVQAEISGNRMILIGMNKGRKTAPDGVYKGLDGKSIVVRGGIIVPGSAAAPGAHKSAPAIKGELVPAVRPSAGIIGPLDSQAHKSAPMRQGIKATPPAASGKSDMKY